MRIITVNLPQTYLKAIDALTGRNGLYPSRSELIRVAVRDWLLKEIDDSKRFEQFTTAFKQQIPKKYVEPDPNIISFEDGTVLTLKPRGIVQ